MHKTAIVSAVAALVLSACSVIRMPTAVRGSGNVVTESRPISGVREVVLTGAGELVIRQSGRESLTVESDDNILPIIITEVRDGRLLIGLRPNTVPANVTRLKYTLDVNELDAIELTGAGRIDAQNLSGPSLGVSSSGVGSISASGKVGSQTIRISGAGSYDGAGLESETADVEISGLGDAVVRVRDSLDVTVSGAGTVNYIGDPEVSKQISGAGTVQQRAP